MLLLTPCKYFINVENLFVLKKFAQKCDLNFIKICHQKISPEFNTNKNHTFPNFERKILANS